jgi:hypothetical protein
MDCCYIASSCSDSLPLARPEKIRCRKLQPWHSCIDVCTCLRYVFMDDGNNKFGICAHQVSKRIIYRPYIANFKIFLAIKISSTILLTDDILMILRKRNHNYLGSYKVTSFLFHILILLIKKELISPTIQLLV